MLPSSDPRPQRSGGSARALRAACALVLAVTATAAQAHPPAAVLDALRTAGLPREALAFAVVPLEAARHAPPARLWQAERSMAPGSAMKVVTAAVALDAVGPNHRGRTEVWTQAPQLGDVLRGDLVLRGGADADLDAVQVRALLAPLRWQGVREIAGDIVLDRTLFEPARVDIGLPPFDEAPQAPYNVVPDALNLGGILLQVELREADGRVTARTLPPLPQLVLDGSELTTTNRSCARWDDDWKPPRSVEGADGTLRVLLQGGFPRGCTQRTWLNVIDRNVLADRVLREAWTSLGGTWAGRVRDADRPTVGTFDPVAPPLANLLPIAPAPVRGARRATAPAAPKPPAPRPVPAPPAAAPQATAQAAAPSAPTVAADGSAAASAADPASPPAAWRLLSSHAARPWGELLRPMLKQSDNVLSRLLFLELARAADAPGARPADDAPVAAAASPTAGGEAGAPPNEVAATPPTAPEGGAAPRVPTAERAGAVVRQWFDARGIPTAGLVLDNGSGLSRSERISPAQMAAVLKSALDGRWAPELLAGLPLAGVDGTMRRRLRDSPAGGWARLKTGTLRDAVALAGVVRDPQGRSWIVAAMVNHDRALAQGRAVLDALIDWVARGGEDPVPLQSLR